MKYFLGEVAKIVDGRLIGDENIPVSGFSTDTRTLKEGELFFAIKGERFNGENFVEDAFKRGASGAVVSSNFLPERRNIIKVEDTVSALGRLAAFHRKNLRNVTVLAVTGSTGKTTTKEMVYHALKSSFRCYRSPKSYNNFIGVPLTILRVNEDLDTLISEIGTNHPGEIGKLSAIVKPHIAIITSIGRSHLEFFKSVDKVAEEKASILEHLEDPGIAIINKDTNFLTLFQKRATKLITVSTKDENADYHAKIGYLDFEKVEFTINGKFELRLNPGGYGTVYGALFAFAVGKVLGISEDRIMEGLMEFKGVGMRKELIRFRNFTILNDAYNANPDSMEDFLITLLPYRDRVILVLGDMFELGENSEFFHREIGKKIRELGFRRLLTLGELARFYNMEAGDLELNMHMKSHEEIVEFLSNISGEVFLALKASRAMEFEKIVGKLRRK